MYPLQTYFPATYQPAQPSASLIWVGSYMEAQSYPVAPNNAVALWDSNSPAIYLKQSDAAGRPSLKVFDLVERTETAQTAPGSTQPDYATKSDLAAFNAVIDALKTDIETIRGDLYGLAGKKTRKKEGEEE